MSFSEECTGIYKKCTVFLHRTNPPVLTTFQAAIAIEIRTRQPCCKIRQRPTYTTPLQKFQIMSQFLTWFRLSQTCSEILSPKIVEDSKYIQLFSQTKLTHNIPFIFFIKRFRSQNICTFKHQREWLRLFL